MTGQPVAATVSALALQVDLAAYFLRPLGLLALALLVPLVLLYLVRPEPQHRVLPTLQFLLAGGERGTDRPALERLRRSLLLVIQVLALVLLASALAAPYVPVASETVVEETVLVVDTSASMQATDVPAGTRFVAGRTLATDATTATTSVVTTAAVPHVVLHRGGSREAEAALASLATTDAPGDLAGAISMASALATADARIVVVSDFAGTSDWRAAVAVARAGGVEVALRQVGGPLDNAGIVDVVHGRTSLTATVANHGERRVTRTLRLGSQRRELALAPGDVATATFGVPAGTSQLVLEGHDAFPADDTVPVAGPDRTRIRVLLLTNGESRHLRTALSVLDEVDLTVANPPTAVTDEYDLFVFADVAPERMLQGTLEAARETARDGGGVIVVGQPDVAAVGYGDLLLLDPAGLQATPRVEVTPDPLTSGITFPAPLEYVAGDLRAGRAVVSTGEGTPLVATGPYGEGRVVYVGYLSERSAFRDTYQYPVFWKRAVYHAVDRPALSETNRETGTTLAFANTTTVDTPGGRRETASILLEDAGFYRTDQRRYAAALLDPAESNVTAPPVARAGEGPGGTGTERTTVPSPLTPFVALAAAATVLAELLVLRRRGDL